MPYNGVTETGTAMSRTRDFPQWTPKWMPKWMPNWTPSLAEMASLATILRDLARNEGEEGRTAIAWALLNRHDAAPCRHPAGPGADFSDRDFARAMLALCRVWAGDKPDPTHGATRFHPHTECPPWAANETPCALIGEHLFYAPRFRGHHP
tara:strand:+ start:4507 stop:4959 length:453 start_codon:yes stop_codon:yes gene_type:complete